MSYFTRKKKMEKLVKHEKAIRILWLIAILWTWNSITNLLFILLSMYVGFLIINLIVDVIRKVEEKWILRKY